MSGHRRPRTPGFRTYASCHRDGLLRRMCCTHFPPLTAPVQDRIFLRTVGAPCGRSRAPCCRISLSTKTANGLLHFTLGFGWSHRRCHAGGYALLHATFVGIVAGPPPHRWQVQRGHHERGPPDPVRLGTLDIVKGPPTLYRTHFPSLASCVPSFGLGWSLTEHLKIFTERTRDHLRCEGTAAKQFMIRGWH